MNVLGVSAYYHDSAAALVCDGRLVAASQEERFSRVKHDARFPARAFRACLEQGGVEAAALDAVCFYEKPLLHLERAIETALAVAPRGRAAFARGLSRWLGDRLRFERELRSLGFSGRVLFAGHHESHAASAFFASPFPEAAVLTVDGVGEWSTVGIWTGSGGRVTPVCEQRFPHSLGLLYSTMTAYLGFEVNEGEYKVMGLSPYGTPRYSERLLEHVLHLCEDGSLSLNMEHFAFLEGDTRMWSPRWEELLGVPPRTPGAELRREHADLAASVQDVTERVVSRLAEHAAELTGLRHLCLAGGVALNSVAAGKLATSGRFSGVFVQPAAGDAGGAVGAAFVGYHHALLQPRVEPVTEGMRSASLGPSFDDATCLAALRANDLEGEQLGASLPRRVAELLNAGEVVGWLSGPMEFGPRALGHRSILADPRSPDMRERVNLKVKFREGFRPFAPIVMASRVSEWFEWSGPSPYMSFVVPTRGFDAIKQGEPEWLRSVRHGPLPAVTHVDGSARVQTASAADPAELHAVLVEFERLTGVPVLLNTSFNVGGEPIVCSPDDACRSFLASGLDALVLEGWLVRRPADRPPTRQPPPARPRPPDLRATARRGLRSAALLALTCGVLLLIGRGRWALVPALSCVALVFSARFAPGALAKLEDRVHAWAARAGGASAFAAAWLLHLLLLTPVGRLRRRRGKDPLGLGTKRDAESYFVPVPATDLEDPYDRMY
ncbi:MAG: carbamoyltransferase [Myxococcales bacterium]|nr:carbamoyltransferase [Myxococcales bacterium]